jgi:hypothetical protein
MLDLTLSMPVSWYEEIDQISSDPFNQVAGFVASGWFGPSLSLQIVSGTKAYAKMPYSEYTNILAASATGGLVVDTVPLTAEKATTFRNTLSIAVEAAEVPLLLETAIGVLSSFLITAPAAGASAGSFFTYIFGQTQAIGVNARLLRHVVANGGKINRILSGYQMAGFEKERIVHTFEYQVSVGSENRSYVVCSFTYPVKFIFSELRTGSPNQKVLTPHTAQKWRRFDVDSNTFDMPDFVETHRDDNFIYLVEDEPQGSAYRVSYRGGPFQRKNAAGNWKTLYAGVTPS